jgi:hypothetical protein
MHKTFIRKSKRKGPVGTPTRRWVGNIKIDLLFIYGLFNGAVNSLDYKRPRADFNEILHQDID